MSEGAKKVIRISDSDAGLVDRATTKVASHANHRIVFLASRHAVYQCLTQAAQQYFSFFDISLLDQLPSAGIPDENVSLVLLGGRQEFASTAHVDECRKCYPRAAFGLMIDGTAEGVDSVLIEQRLIQGVLPLSLPLDVWLAVVSLLVSGGEYLLPGIVGALTSPQAYGHRHEPSDEHRAMTEREPYRPAAAAIDAMRDEVTAPPHAARGQHGDEADGIAALTVREREILQLVSEGYQNKIIADRMALSEHTVKAHVHNLIAKLRVTNRTQAAAFLHDQRFARGIHGARPPAGFVALHGR